MRPSGKRKRGRVRAILTWVAMLIGVAYLFSLTTLVALPGVMLFWYMIRSGLADVSMGSAGNEAGPRA